MSHNIPKRVIDITGVELTPGKPGVCLGNGERGFECCCDECDYFLFCFPEFGPKSQESCLPIEKRTENVKNRLCPFPVDR